jgi:hypothetical protein
VDGSIIRVGERARYDISASVPHPDDLDMRGRNLTRPIEKVIRGGQYYFSAPATLALAVAVGHDRLQLGPIRRAQVKANVVASHVDPLHAVNQRYD